MKRRTLVSWGKYLAVALPLVGAAGTVVIYAEDVRGSLADIQKEQVEIRRTQEVIVRTVESGNDRIVSEVSRNGLALAVELGRVSERTGEQE